MLLCPTEFIIVYHEILFLPIYIHLNANKEYDYEEYDCFGLNRDISDSELINEVVN